MNIDQIIGKLMGDDSIGEEKAALESWKKEAEDNIKALEDIRKIAAISNTLENYQEFDVDKAWDAIETNSSLDSNNSESIPVQQRNETKVFKLNAWSKAAAMVVILIGALFAFNSYNLKSDEFVAVPYAAEMEQKTIDLDDGSNILLDTHSKLRLNAERSVALKGRAYFDISKDPNKRFTVNLPVGNIEVLGTKFTVDANDERTEIYLEEGSINYSLAGETYTMNAGDLIKVENNDVDRTNTTSKNVMSWVSKRIMFRDHNMTQVVTALSKHYKKDIIIKNPKDFIKCNVHSDFVDATLEDILNEFSIIHGLKYNIEGDKYIIVSSKC